MARSKLKSSAATEGTIPLVVFMGRSPFGWSARPKPFGHGHTWDFARLGQTLRGQIFSLSGPSVRPSRPDKHRSTLRGYSAHRFAGAGLALRVTGMRIRQTHDVPASSRASTRHSINALSNAQGAMFSSRGHTKDEARGSLLWSKHGTRAPCAHGQVCQSRAILRFGQPSPRPTLGRVWAWAQNGHSLGTEAKIADRARSEARAMH